MLPEAGEIKETMVIKKELKKIQYIFIQGFEFQILSKGFKIIFGLIITTLVGLGLFAFLVDPELGLLSFLQASFCGAGLLYLTQIHPILPKNEKIGSDTSTFRHYRLILAIIFGFFSLIYIIIKFLSFPNHFESHVLSKKDIILFIYSCLVPFSEELFFRGFLIRVFAQNQKIQSSPIYLLLVLTLQSFIWSLLHVNYYQIYMNLISICVSGIFFGFLYIFSKKIQYPIILHFIGNLIANIITYF
ncbi:MAG: lysostaphin resistance A-like protein [Promethearchaeota archaeon]